MFNAYTPQRLILAKEEIIEVHKSEHEVKEVVPNDHLKELILRLVSLEEFQLKKAALSLSDTEILLLAGYIPHNYYNVKMNNLFAIYKYCANDESTDILYSEWQNSYDNVECNNFFIDLMKYDERFIVLVRRYNLPEKEFEPILFSPNIPVSFGEKVYKSNIPGGFIKKLEGFGLEDGKKLYIACIMMFYTFCNKEDYLSADKDRLNTIVSKYSVLTLRTFIINLLSKLELKDLKQFRTLAAYLIQEIGDVGTSKYAKFFEGMRYDIVQKYKNWINIYKINKYFANDERAEFWERYEFVSTKFHNMSDCFVMESESYYVVEFLGHQMGPIYIYSRDIFEKKISKWIPRNNNNDLRSLLFKNQELSAYRKTHNGYWQREVHGILTHNNIAKRIM